MVNLFISADVEGEEIDYIRDQLFRNNLLVAPPTSEVISQDVNLILKDTNKKILGGLIGKIYRGCLFIDILWVDEVARGLGYGKQMLKKAEEIASRQQCKFIHLDTFSFQAPDFYMKNGYEVFGVLDGYPNDVKRYYLKKDI